MEKVEQHTRLLYSVRRRKRCENEEKDFLEQLFDHALVYYNNVFHFCAGDLILMFTTTRNSCLFEMDRVDFIK